MLSCQTLQYTVEDGVATVTLNRPDRRNAIDAVMRGELAQVVHHLEQDHTVRAVVLTGAGGAFCAGGDIEGMRETVDAAQARQRMVDVHHWLAPLIRLDRPVIAAVDGVAYGAGFGLALAADIVLASPRARFCLSFLRMGLVPDCGVLYTLPRVVGLQRARELLYSARELDASAAQALGIVCEIHPQATLAARAQQLAQHLCQASPTALALTKQALHVSLGASLEDVLAIEANAQGIARTTAAHRDAARRFLDKQPLAYQWPPLPPA